MGIGDWGLGIGGWGWGASVGGVGFCGLPPPPHTPTPQSPIPNPQSPIFCLLLFISNYFNL